MWLYTMRSEFKAKPFLNLYDFIFFILFQILMNALATHVSMEVSALMVLLGTHATVPMDLRDLSVEQVSYT